MYGYRENLVKELKVQINSLIELHTLKFIDDTTFYSDMKSYMDQLDEINAENIVVDEKIPFESKPEEENNLVDDVIKNLQHQLLAVKSDNINTMHKLTKETNSEIIEEQNRYLNQRVDYINNCVVPLKEIHNKLYEECATLE